MHGCRGRANTIRHTKNMHEHPELCVESSFQHDEVVAFNSKPGRAAMNSAPTGTGMISSKQLVCPTCGVLLKFDIQAMLDNRAGMFLRKHNCHRVSSQKFDEVTDLTKFSYHNNTWRLKTQ